MYPPHDLGGGYEITWRAWVRDMRERGDAVRVLTTDWRRPGLAPTEELDPDVHRALRWYWRDHEFPRMGLRARMLIERHNAEVLDQHRRDFKPDVVNWWGMGGMSLSLVERVRRSPLPAVGVVGDEWLRWGPRVDRWLSTFRFAPPAARLAERVTGLPARLDLETAATWLFNSEKVREEALAAHPGLRRTSVVHPGIDDGLFRPAPPQAWEWRLLYIGRMDPRKGVHVAVEALASLPEQATLTLQGSGDERYIVELRSRADSLGLGKRVRFLSEPRQRLPNLYAGADTVLFPVQWEEPWGLVPLEAMAVGRPVIATGTGGSAEYLRHEENALVYQPRDSPAALAGAVERLAADDALRARICERGTATAARFTESAYNDAIRTAIRKAIGSSP